MIRTLNNTLVYMAKCLSILLTACVFMFSPMVCYSEPMSQDYQNSSDTTNSSLTQKGTSIDIENFVNLSDSLEAGLFNNSVLKIKYTPRKNADAVDRNAICWKPRASIKAESNYNDKKIDVISPIKIDLTLKGQRGNEFIDLNIYTDGNKVLKLPLILSTNWTDYSTYIYPVNSINLICLEFNSYKNPITSTVYISKIRISYGKNVDAVQTIENQIILA
jgi:hypothetical protein